MVSTNYYNLLSKTGLAKFRKTYHATSLLYLGCALANSSEWQWQTGKTHVFEYSGRLLSQVPHLATHYSGLGLNATVMIDVLSNQKLQLSLDNARFTNVNQRLESRLTSNDGLDGQNWREVYLPQMTEVDSQIMELLRQPIVFEMVSSILKRSRN